MDIVSYILSKSYVDKTLVGMGALKGAPAMISSIVDNPDGTHDITFSWKDNSDVTHTSVLTVANGETPTIISTEIEGGHTITFTTTDPSQSVSFNVMDGLEGQRGVSVIRADVDNNNYLKLELSDGNIINAGQIKTVSMVDNTLSLESANPVENRVITSALNDKVNKVSGKQLSTEDFTTAEKNKLTNIENGAQVNTLENLIINGEEATIVDKKIALNIITSAVSNLQNYYLKSETYTKTEVEELIGSTVGVTIEIVQELPIIGQTNVIYFVPTETANVYSQYIYTANDGWVLIGSTSVDLSNYYTKGQVDTLLNGKQNVLTIDAFPTAMSNNPVASGGVYSAIAQMQPQFQFTNMPTASESNYGFVYQYIGSAGTYEPNMFYRCVYNTYAGEYRWEEVIFHATVTVDNELSSTSTNPVQNKVVKEALDTKQDIMQFSTMPNAQDNLGKIVQYTGVTTATYQNGCFYKAVYDSVHDTYVWTIVRFSADISVDNVLSDVSENPVQNKVITNKFDEYKTAFTGTEEEWNALTSEEQNVYDIINITNDGDVLNLGVYLEKTTAMPVASEDVANKIYLYTGTTTQNYKKGVVYQCVSDGQTPATYSWVALIDLGTAATKNYTVNVRPNSHDLVESNAVYNAIASSIASVYKPHGNLTCAELTSDLLVEANIGNIYNMSDSGTTNTLFIQGEGKPIAVNNTVGIIRAGQDAIMFNLMGSLIDLHEYQKQELDIPITIDGTQQTTVEGALGALSTNKQAKDLTTAVESATTVEGALSALSTNKANVSTTLAGYGITNAYTKTETDTEISDAISALDVTDTAVNGSYVTAVSETDGEISVTREASDVTPTASSTKMVRSGGVYDAVNNVYVANGVLGAKNLIPITLENLIKLNVNGTWESNVYTYNGISYTIVTDGLNITKISVQGTSSESFLILSNFDFGNQKLSTAGTVTANGYTISGGVNSKQLCQYNNTNRLTSINISNGEVISTSVDFYPMIRLASDTDNTFQPYAKTNRELTVETEALTNEVNDMNNVLGAKNLLPITRPSRTTNTGVTFTVNSDGSVTVNGTASADTWFQLCDGFKLKNARYTLTGCPSGGSSTTYELQFRSTESDSSEWQMVNDYGNGKTATGDPTRTYIGFVGIHSGYTATNLTFYPMLRLASDNDDTYQPYAMTNRQLTVDKLSYADNSVLGAKNLLIYPYTDTTKTVNGITFTDNADGTITVSGTATANVAFALQMCPDFGNKLPLILSGCPTGGAYNSGYRLQYSNYTDMTDLVVDTGEGAVITKQINYSTYPSARISIEVRNGTVLSTPITFKPMLRLADDSDATYQPYAKTNRELTNGFIYSTNETNTGKTWIDGKPIYRKVYKINSPDVTWVSQHIDTLSINNVVSVNTIGNRSGELINEYRNSDADYFAAHLCVRTNGHLEIYVKCSTQLNYVQYVVEYTKK